MSDLNNRIKLWRDAFASRISAAVLDELEDHLRQTLAALPEDALSIDERFLVATRRLGAPEPLVAEFAMARKTRACSGRAAWMLLLGVACLGTGTSVGILTLYNLDERFAGHFNEGLPQPVLIRFCLTLLMTGLGTWSLMRSRRLIRSEPGSAVP